MFGSGGPLPPRRGSALVADALQSFYNDTALHVPERFRAEFAPSASPMKVNSRAVSFATLIQFSGAVPGKTSSLNLAPAQPSMAGRPMPLEAPLRKRGSGPRAIPGGICAFGVPDEGELPRGVDATLIQFSG